MNIVWFKKDLRIQDHAALCHSLETNKTVGLFIFEPEWLQSPEFDIKQLRFVLESLRELRLNLARLGVPLLLREGSAPQVFGELHRKAKISALFSHQETGLLWSFERDIKMKSWCRDNSIPWKEFKQFAVIRGLKDRDTWNEKRKEIIERKTLQAKPQEPLTPPWLLGNEPNQAEKIIQSGDFILKGGSSRAHYLLNSFMKERGQHYLRSLSSPTKAFDGCSRLSPYITWGNISITEIHQALSLRKRQLVSEPYSWGWQNSLQQFESRLWWHCHFIQKLESEPEVEFSNFNKKFDGLREAEFDEAKFQAWCRGETGFPMIDACMRAPHQHGWINFRMRALLISFASYQLWLHWKKPAEFLARQFLDFEPGIHYSQIQMQAGVTGINTIRIYSPKKQFLDQDPDGDFVKKYIPELRGLSVADLAEPHMMPPLLQLEAGFKPGSSYPHPIVDPEASYQKARDRIFSWKDRPEVKVEAKRVQKKHGSRKTK
jgi:deoxyribodipyrimidine photo-lyase